MPTNKPALRRVFYITSAHTAIDFYMLLSPPLWAFFKTHFSLTLSQVAILPSVVSVCGSITQPFMGYLGDRRNCMALVALGVLICAVFVSSIGFAPSAPILALILIAASMGSSLFHPNAGGLVTRLLPERSNMAMAIFLTGGTLGMAIAPIVGTQIIVRHGLEKIWIIIFPGLILSAFLYLASRKSAPEEIQTAPARFDLSILRTQAMRPLLVLYAISVLRSLIHSGFVSFTALLGESWGWSTDKIGWVFSGYLLANTAGRMVGGYLGDRVSPRKLLAFSNATSALFHIGFCLFPGPAAVPLFFIAGFLFDLGITTNIVLAQRILPQNTSTATGLVMGFAWGASGLMIPLIGKLAEFTSIADALTVVSLSLIPATILVALLPTEISTQTEPAKATADD